MINKNFKSYCKLQAVFISGQSSTGKAGFRYSSGDYHEKGLYNDNTFTNNTYRKIYLGSGTTQPSVEDYTMESIIEDLTEISVQTDPTGTLNTGTAEDKYNRNYIYKGTITVRNDTDSSITVSEIGLGMTDPAYTDEYILIDREVISPVTIQSGETYTFVVTIGG